MTNDASSNLDQKVPTYIPLADAAQKYGISEEALTQLIEAGKIEAVQLPSGELLVADNNGHSQEYRTKEQIIAEEYSYLQGRQITVSDASEKYDIAGPTIRKWIKNKYIEIVSSDEYPMKIDEAEIAYCEKIYREQGGKSGARIFDDNGRPYQLKHPKLAAYRQRKRQEQQSVRVS